MLRLWVVPNIETFYPKLESYIEERTGTLIEARDIHVDWERLRPRITLTDVTFARPGTPCLFESSKGSGDLFTHVNLYPTANLFPAGYFQP